MVYKNYLKTSKITLLIILITFMSFEVVQSKSYAAENGIDWLDDNPVNNGPTDKFDGYTKMASAFLIVIVLIIVTVYVLKRKFGVTRNFGKSERRIHVIEHATLGVKKSIFLVRVPGKHLLIGVTNDKMDLITEIANEDVDEGEESVNKNEFLGLIKKSHLEQKEK